MEECSPQRNSKTKILLTQIVYDNSHGGGGRKGFAVMRFCGNFYFKLAYDGFTKPSGLRYLEMFGQFQCGLRFSYVFLCGIYTYIYFGAVLRYSYPPPPPTPSYAPLVMALVFSSNKTVINKDETIHHFHIDQNAPCLPPPPPPPPPPFPPPPKKTLHNHCLGFLLGRL